MAAKKSAVKRTAAKPPAKKTAARKSSTKAETKAEATVQTNDGGQTTSRVPRVPAGGIDPRLVEQRDKQRELEKGVVYARSSEPARLDPKLAEIRERTIKRERELANRSLRKNPARG